jgi:hypothetical protein
MASGATTQPFQVVDLPPAPHQPSPSFIFPKRSFGKKNGCFAVVSADLVPTLGMVTLR